ncbi:MAG: GTP 3',8-cyclase MoaA, partial [Actinomycetota bacterium]
ANAVDVEAFDSIRLTGGEPTVRAHLPVLVEKLSRLGVRDGADSPRAGQKIDLALTTNGATLRLLADELKSAGLERINISLDTLQSEKFFKITRRDHLANVLDGIDAAIQAGFSPVKINAVIQRGVNDDEILALARFGREKQVEVRFIEFMPLDAQGEWRADSVVGQDEIVAQINQVFPLEQQAARGAAPADSWRYLDGGGTVGVIPSVTKPFCGDCDRVRLTAEGQFRTCLFSTTEFDLRAKLRGGASDDAIADEIKRAVGTKWAGHAIGNVTFVRPKRSMSQIGG